MNVLGISAYYHDSSATLVRDGKVLAAAEEERFSRKKHDSRFPLQAIKFCLESQGLGAEDVDLVCFYEKPMRKLARVLQTAKTWRNVASAEDVSADNLAQSVHERMWIQETLKDELGIDCELLFSEHHLSHAASSFYISDFQEAAILTVDGIGEYDSTAEFIGNGTSIVKTREIRYPHSLGLLYSTVTSFLGFKVNNDEYKVMGLASYGKPTYRDKLDKLIRVAPDGSYQLALEYFSFMYDDQRMYSDALVEEFGTPRVPESEISSEHMNLAASVQDLLEEVMVKLGNSLHERSGGLDNLCLSGGVALNCVANLKVLEQTPFKRICIQPAAGDGGCSLGAALYAYYEQSGKPRQTARHSTLLGPDFSNEEIEKLLEGEGAMYTKLDDSALCKKVAELIAENAIVGWFQGRMEFGPRALGSRSILANPCNPDMKDILNNRVKFREDFRPFAPAVLAEEAQGYFQMEDESPHMLFVYHVKPEMAERLPSVTHSDGTARVQTVSHEDNPRFHQLIQEFGELTGVPIVINTSFNVRGEPIVCSPKDAYDCFLNTDIDYLAIGNYLVEKLA